MPYPQLKINGFAYDRSNVRITFTALPLVLQNYIKEMSYSDQMEGAALVYGGQVTPLSSTYGEYKGEFGFTILREGYEILLASVPPGYTGYKIAAVTINYLNPFDAVGISGGGNVDLITFVRITGADTSVSQGGKDVEVKVKCLVEGTITRNLKSLVPTDQDLAILSA